MADAARRNRPEVTTRWRLMGLLLFLLPHPVTRSIRKPLSQGKPSTIAHRVCPSLVAVCRIVFSASRCILCCVFVVGCAAMVVRGGGRGLCGDDHGAVSGFGLVCALMRAQSPNHDHHRHHNRTWTFRRARSSLTFPLVASPADALRRCLRSCRPRWQCQPFCW